MRLLNRIYAWLFGFFWLPCPVCGREFGGHEAGYGALISVDGQRANIVCDDPECSHDAAVMNMSRGFGQAVNPARGNLEDAAK
ncbi:MAG: hypothetical protein V4858_17140 [Pseudomonadota bacterium]